MFSFQANKLFLLFLTAALTIFSACEKSNEDPAELLTDAEAAEIVETTVSDRSAGVAMPAVDMAAILAGYLDNCGVPGDTTLQRSNSIGTVNYDYTFDLGWLINCTNLGVPLDAQVTIAGDGTFAGQRWNGTDLTSGSLTFTGLNPQATEYLVNGVYELEGAMTGYLRNIDPTLDITATVDLTDLTIRKTDNYITGGTGAIEMTATNGRGRTETVTGALVFNGDGTATVTVNGHTHTFQVQ